MIRTPAQRRCSDRQANPEEPRNRAERRARSGQATGRTGSGAEHRRRSVGICRRIENYVERVRLSAWGVAPVIGQVDVTPTTTGLPGGELAQKLLNWLAQGALWGCLAALLIGGLVWGLSARAGNSLQAGTGKTFAIGGAVGALIAGLAPTIVNTFFNEAQ
jgi:hypothetical protein